MVVNMIANEVKHLMWQFVKDDRYSSKVGDYVMHMAVDSRDISLVNEIIKAGGYMDIPNEDGYTPLHLSVFNCDYDMTKLLLLAGANPNMLCLTTYESPLHFAAITGDKQMILLLLKYGADINLFDRKRITPLEQLLLSGHKDLFLELFRECNDFGGSIGTISLMGCYEIALNQNEKEIEDLLNVFISLNHS